MTEFRCVYCGEGGARTLVLGGRAHKKCLPTKWRGRKIRNSIHREISIESRKKYPLKIENRYGVDVEYFRKELLKLVKTLPDRTHEELERYLVRLAKVAEPSSAPEIPTGHKGGIQCS